MSASVLAILVMAPVSAAGAASVPASTAFTPVSPVRLVDTRGGSPVAANSVVEFQITGGVVPSSATAVMVNVTSTQALGAGWLQVFPTGHAAVGSSSTLNRDFSGPDVPNASFAPLGGGGRLSVYSTFTSHVIIDVFGYFTPAAASSSGRLVPLTPTRILDTRSGIGWTPPTPTPPPPAPPAPGPSPPPNPGDTRNCSDFATWAEAKAWFDTYYPYYGDVAMLDGDGDGIPCESLSGAPTWLGAANVPTDTTITLQVAGRGGVPVSGVSAVVMNVTAADPQSDGWVQVGPTPVAVGASSNLNTTQGRTVANLVVVPVSAAGTVDFYTNVNVDLLADVVGYFTDTSAAASSAGLFVPIPPNRQLDTRQPDDPPPLAAGSTVGVDINDITSSAVAVAGNLTASAAASGGWVQVAAPPLTVGASSNLNIAYDGQTVANALVTPVAAGRLDVYTYRSAHLLVDVTGWFTNGASTSPAAAAAAIVELAALGTTPGVAPVAYNRDEWLPDWADTDGDCINTRHEVLIAEADAPVTMSAGGCTVTAGLWNDPYTGQTFTDPQDLDIDHLVALADAHRSGGWQWPTSQKQAYANDLTHAETLIAVDDATNSSKGDQSPDEWLPPNGVYHCTYAIEWVTVKRSWTLTVTANERNTLNTILASC